MSDEVRQLRVEVQVLARAVSRFESSLAGLREEMIKGFDRMDILLAEQHGEVVKLVAHLSERIDALESRADERHAELLEAIRNLGR